MKRLIYKAFGIFSKIQNAIRKASYQEAIHEVEKKGDIVADKGTGSGILAFLPSQPEREGCIE